MGALIEQNRRAGREVGQWLSAIDVFDRLVTDRATLERLVDAASDLTRRRIHVLDALNGRFCSGGPRDPASVGAPPDEEAETIATITASALHAREAVVVGTARGEVVAASVDDAGGRIGVCWLVADEAPWRPLDELVAQRLSAAVAIDSVRLRDERATRGRHDDTGLERLLSMQLSEEEAAVAVRHAGLRPGRRLVALAVRARPGGSVAVEAIGQMLARALEHSGLSARSTVIGRSAAVVVEAGSALDEALRQASTSLGSLGVEVEIGAGRVVEPRGLHSSWREAAKALLLRPVTASTSAITHFDDLGVLHLLAEIPMDDLGGYRDMVRLAALDTSGPSASDLDLLERYLATMSLRRTAQEVHLHHTTVQYRLKRIEEALGIDLGDPAARLRTQLAILLHRIERAANVTGG